MERNVSNAKQAAEASTLKWPKLHFREWKEISFAESSGPPRNEHKKAVDEKSQNEVEIKFTHQNIYGCRVECAVKTAMIWLLHSPVAATFCAFRLGEKPFFKESPKKVAQEGHLLAPPLRNCTATIAASPRIVDRGYLIIHFMFRLFSFLHWYVFISAWRTHERTFDHVVRGRSMHLTGHRVFTHVVARDIHQNKKKCSLCLSRFAIQFKLHLMTQPIGCLFFRRCDWEIKRRERDEKGKKRGSNEPVWSAGGKDVSMLNASSRLVVPIPRTLARVSSPSTFQSRSLLLVLLEQSLFFGGGKQQTFFAVCVFFFFSSHPRLFTLNGVSQRFIVKAEQLLLKHGGLSSYANISSYFTLLPLDFSWWNIFSSSRPPTPRVWWIVGITTGVGQQSSFANHSTTQTLATA